MGNSQEQIAELKEKYLSYYKDLPVQKYAAMYIGRSEDTIIDWKKNDSNFSDRVTAARAEWVRRKASKAKVEFALERLEKQIFALRIEHDIPKDTVGEILRGFGLVNDGQNQKATNNTSQE